MQKRKRRRSIRDTFKPSIPHCDKVYAILEGYGYTRVGPWREAKSGFTLCDAAYGNIPLTMLWFAGIGQLCISEKFNKDDTSGMTFIIATMKWTGSKWECDRMDTAYWIMQDGRFDHP